MTFASGDSRYTLLCRTVQVGDRRLVVGEAPAANARIEEDLFRSNNALAVLAREAARQNARIERSARGSEGRLTTPPEQTLGEEFLDAILATDRRRAADLAIAALQRGVGVEELYVGVLQESLHEVGRRWQSNTITVADEHAATAVVQLATGCGSSSAGRPRRSSM